MITLIKISAGENFAVYSQGLHSSCGRMISGKKILEWLVKGRTVFIPKDGCKDKRDKSD